MKSSYKLLICAAVAVLVQAFPLPHVINAVDAFFGLSNLLAGDDTLTLVFNALLFSMIPNLVILFSAMCTYYVWSQSKRTPLQLIYTVLGFVLTYGLASLIWWIVLFYLNADAAYTQLQFTVIGTIDGLQEIQGYALQYLLSWLLFLAPYVIGAIFASEVSKGRSVEPSAF